MVSCSIYKSEAKQIWNDFVKDSRTPLFFFQREFMEYHSDRFSDFSLMFYDDEKLVALLPACNVNNELVSHAGLTYGGLILGAKTRAEIVLDIIKQLIEFTKEQGFSKIVYKAIPYIFYEQAAQDDLYSLFYHANAKLVRRDLSSVIKLNNRIGLSKGRKWLVARAKKNELAVTESTNWHGFYELLCSVLSKHSTKPVHSPEEFQLLKSRFPEEIELKTIVLQEQILAATLLFKFKNTVHTQYMAVSDHGREMGALDYLIETVIRDSIEKNFDYFSFGISTEENGRILNSGLIAQKESFGAHSIVLDFYEVYLNED